jgi:hypothetical protein
MKYKCDTDCSDIENDSIIKQKEKTEYNSTKHKSNINYSIDSIQTDSDESNEIDNKRHYNNLFTKKYILDFSIDIQKLPFLYFILGMILLVYSVLEFSPQFYSFLNNNDIFNQRFRIKHFSFFLSNINIPLRVFFLFSIMIFSAYMFTLASIIRQKMAVPELKNQRYKISIMTISLMIYTTIYILLIFSFRAFDEISKFKLGLFDNVLFSLLMVSGLSLFYASNNILLVLSNNENRVNKNHGYYVVKNYLIILMIALTIICKIN